ncbi:hypothetical protein BDV11DRAFT_181624 [Aspergillus similis]
MHCSTSFSSTGVLTPSLLSAQAATVTSIRDVEPRAPRAARRILTATARAGDEPRVELTYPHRHLGSLLPRSWDWFGRVYRVNRHVQ